MGKSTRFVFITACLAFIISCLCFSALAHSGRTDMHGGHNDLYNVEDLGDYHYHCGGYPAHLHTDGKCPYDSTGTSQTDGTEMREIPFCTAEVTASTDKISRFDGSTTKKELMYITLSVLTASVASILYVCNRTRN